MRSRAEGRGAWRCEVAYLADVYKSLLGEAGDPDERTEVLDAHHLMSFNETQIIARKPRLET